MSDLRYSTLTPDLSPPQHFDEKFSSHAFKSPHTRYCLLSLNPSSFESKISVTLLTQLKNERLL